MKIGDQIKAIAKGFEEVQRQIAEVETQINHSGRPASERRALRARWNRTIKAHGLEWFIPTKKTPSKNSRKKSQDYLSEAIYQKSLAAKFKAAGDLDRSNTAMNLSKKAEEKGRRLREREEKSN